MMVVGDCCAQQLEEGRRRHRCSEGGQREEDHVVPPLDLQRTVIMATYSGAIFTPLFYCLYQVFDRVLVGPPALVAAQKALGSVALGGSVANTCFLTLTTTAEMQLLGRRPTSGAPLADVVRTKLREDLLRLMTGSLLFWAPFNFANFYWTPPRYRILGMSAAAVMWNCYLSLVQHETFAPPENAAADAQAELERALERETRKSVVYWGGEVPEDRR
jgi:hypothetical protein